MNQYTREELINIFDEQKKDIEDTLSSVDKPLLCFQYKKDYIPQIGNICMNLCSLDLSQEASI
jgi:hypothetical protein